MTTDTAVGVTKLVVQDKSMINLDFVSLLAHNSFAVPLSEIPYKVRSICFIRLRSQLNFFQEFPTIVFNRKESVEMPFSKLRCFQRHGKFTKQIIRVHRQWR